MDIVEQIKQHNLIEDVISEGGYKLPTRARYRKAEHSNGLVVDTKNQTYHWNGRGEYGDVIQWVMSQHGCDFKNACEILCRRAGLPDPQWSGESHEQRIAARKKEDALSVAARVFHAWFWKSDEAQAYVAGRGLTLTRDNNEDATIYSAGTAERAMLGYSGSGNQAERDEMINALRDAGVDVKSPVAMSVLGFKGDVRKWCKDHNIEPDAMDERWINGGYIPGMIGGQRIVFPYKVYGRVVYLAGRAILDKRHYNLPDVLVGKRPELYLSHTYTQKAEHVVIVEGQMDAETWSQWGVAAVSMSGAKLDEDVIKMFRQNHKAIYLVTDVDTTGLIRTWGNAEMLGPLTRIITPKDLHGYQIPTLPTDEESKRKNIELANQIIMAIGKGKGFPIPKSDGEFVNKDLKPGDEGYREVKDSNDLLQALSESTVKATVQEAYASEMLSKSPTFAELAAAWAGAREGAARDAAVKFAIGVIAKIGEMEFAQYRSGLAKSLNVGVRDLQNMLKTYGQEEEKERESEEPNYIRGGYIKGYLIDYMYDNEKGDASFAWRDPEGKIDWGYSLRIDGKLYKPVPPDEAIIDGAIALPSKLGDHYDLPDIINLIEMFLKSVYIFPEGNIVRIVAYYVLTTWIYDAFKSLIYLRATGDAGAGKSQMLMRVGLLCYRYMAGNGTISASSLFRMIERYGPTLFIDEMDLENSTESNEIVKLINSGSFAGKQGYVWRTVEETGIDGKREFVPRRFQTFCPKMIAMRKEFDDNAVATRSLTIRVTNASTAELLDNKISFNISDEMEHRAQIIRNILMRWRLENWEQKMEVSNDMYIREVPPRFNQVAEAMLAISIKDPIQQAEIKCTIREYYQETVLDKSMSIAARIIEAMWMIYQDPELFKEMVIREPDGAEIIKIGHITKIASDIMDEMNDVNGDDESDQPNQRKLKPQTVGNIVRKELQLKSTNRRRDGFFCYWNRPKMEGLAFKFGIKPEDFIPQQKPPEHKQGGLL